MQYGTFNANASIVDGQFVLTGGISQTGVAMDLVQVYDVKGDRWSQPAKLHVGRHSHAQVTLADGRVLVAAGQGGSLTESFRPLASAELIDLKRNAVKLLTDLPGPAEHATAHCLSDGRVAVVGGRSVSVLNPVSLQWERFITLRQVRQEHASVLLPDGKILVIAGTGRNTMELVDVNEGVSQLLRPRFPTVLDDLSASLLPDGRVWVMGGQESASGKTTDQTWIVDLSDPRSTTITPGKPLGIEGGVADHVAVEIGQWVVVAGGESEVDRSDTELSKARICNRKTLEVWSLPELLEPADDAVALRFGIAVYVLGGYRTGPRLFGKVNLPLASRSVQWLSLPQDRIGGDH